MVCVAVLVFFSTALDSLNSGHEEEDLRQLEEALRRGCVACYAAEGIYPPSLEYLKDYYGIRYSDAYEVYGLTRTGCCGCPISYKAVDDLEKIRPFEPNVVEAAWNIFGKSYEYRKKYNDYKKNRLQEEKRKRIEESEQCGLY